MTLEILDTRMLIGPGSITFGGIDTKKFTGKLEKRPIISQESTPDGYLRYTKATTILCSHTTN